MNGPLPEEVHPNPPYTSNLRNRARGSTPLAARNYLRLTSHSEIWQYLEKLATESATISVEVVGESVEGRKIPCIQISRGEFGGERHRKITALIFAQQHGDEPSGKEALLQLASEAADGRLDDLLKYLDVLVLPQVNPDGAEKNQRRNAANVDLNRNHLIADAPEVEALRQVFHRWEPEVTIDLHEYQPWSMAWLRHGFVKTFDVQCGIGTNLNIPGTLTRIAEDAFLPSLKKDLSAGGLSFHNYLVGTPDLLRFSTTAINDGRHGFGIMGTLSFLLEGMAGRGPSDNLRRRVTAQLEAVKSILHFCSTNAEDVFQAVHSARLGLLTGSHDPFVLSMKHAHSRPVAIPVRAVSYDNGAYVPGVRTMVEVDNLRGCVIADRKTSIPPGYLIPSNEAALISFLIRHRIDFEVLDKDIELDVEQYTLDSFKREDFVECQLDMPVVSISRMSHRSRAGDVFVPTRQIRGLLVATALEPESMHGLMHSAAFSHLKCQGVYPVLRSLTALSPWKIPA